MNIGELAKFRGGIGTDTISEVTSASGVTIDSVLCKDGSVTGAASGTFTTTYVKAADTQGLALVNSSGTSVVTVSDAGAVTAGAGTTGTTLTSKGFTALGNGNTAIKMKVLSGTTAAAENSQATVAHGLTSSKIVGVSAHVFYGATAAVSNEYTYSAGYQFSIDFNATTVNLNNHPTNSENILSKGFYALVWYIE